MLRVFRCECGQKMKVTPEMLGKAGRCVHCGRVVTPTAGNAPPMPPRRSDAAPATEERPQPSPVPDSGSDLSEAPDLEELLVPEEDFEDEYEGAEEASRHPPAPRQPPPPPRTRRPEPPQESFGLDTFIRAVDIALDWRKIVVSMALGGICVVGILICIFIGAQDNDLIPVAIVLGVVWAVAWSGIFAGGVGRLVEIELTERRRAPAREAWRFIGRRFVGLAFGTLGLVLAAILLGALVNGIVFLIGMIPWLGPILAGILTLPLFVFNLLLFCVLWNVWIVPCIMAVEDCGAVSAVDRLVQLVVRRAGRLIAYEVIANSIIALVTTLSMVIGYACLGVTAGITSSGLFVGLGMRGRYFGGPGISGVLTQIGIWITVASAVVAILALAGFAGVYALACSTVVYKAARQP
ncbi:MAG TPA: hypothetical protein HPP77_02165 [Candidatus Hydrogenedentes bacterium]|nr:hypothetical protein [Candidatus Hydrogenedentota bacterium]HIJ73967.1 hypothetical protein [Candidatus Hydrogenedentota bacterium]